MTVAGRILSFGLSFRGQPVTTAARDPHQPGPDTRETVTDQGVFAYEGTFNGNHTCGLCVGVPFDQQPAGVGNGTMVALNARSVAHIAELHALALQLGGRDEGGPGHRPQYGDGFHSAYVRDPDGNKLAFVYYASAD